MNASEHIRHITHMLVQEDNITREELVEILSALVTPYVEHVSGRRTPMREPKHFNEANAIVHRILARRNRQRVRAMNPQERAEPDAELRDYRNENRRSRRRARSG